MLPPLASVLHATWSPAAAARKRRTGLTVSNMQRALLSLSYLTRSVIRFLFMKLSFLFAAIKHCFLVSPLTFLALSGSSFSRASYLFTIRGPVLSLDLSRTIRHARLPPTAMLATCLPRRSRSPPRSRLLHTATSSGGSVLSPQKITFCPHTQICQRLYRIPVRCWNAPQSPYSIRQVRASGALTLEETRVGRPDPGPRATFLAISGTQTKTLWLCWSLSPPGLDRGHVILLPPRAAR